MDYRQKRLGFEQNKLKRLIATQGETFIAKGFGVNEFNEPVESEEEYSFEGVWSTTNTFVTKASSDSSNTNKKQSPYILTLINDGTRALNKGFSVVHGERIYEIVDINDINAYGIAYIVSLEEKL